MGCVVLHRLEPELAGRAVVAGARTGLDQEGDVVAGVEAVEDRAGHPPLRGLEDRHPAGPQSPGTAGEDIRVVTGLASEELGQTPVVG
jgi:hypothetical protein